MQRRLALLRVLTDAEAVALRPLGAAALEAAVQAVASRLCGGADGAAPIDDPGPATAMAERAFAYVQARVQARHASLPGVAVWQALEASHTPGHYLALVRAGPLARWADGLAPDAAAPVAWAGQCRRRQALQARRASLAGVDAFEHALFHAGRFQPGTHCL